MTRLNVLKCGWAIVVLTLTLTFWVPLASAITGGEPDGEGHPNIGAIVVILSPEERFELCSGTLIDPVVFLTAGHCTDYLWMLIDSGLTADQVKVSFDSDNAVEEGHLDVIDIVTHPDYNFGPTANPHDVGVLILAEPAGIDPATTAPEGFLDGLREEGKLRERGVAANFTAVGYGATLNWPPPQICAPDGVRRFSEPEYKNLRKAWISLLMNQAPGTGASGVCYGDSGGALFWNEDDVDTLVGVTSWGDARCVANANCYRVDIPDTLDFIDSVLRVQAAPPRDVNRLTAALWGRIKSDY
jgi:secreted trypsin-like serine protease